MPMLDTSMSFGWQNKILPPLSKKIEKPIDKVINVCYNKYNKYERN